MTQRVDLLALLLYLVFFAWNGLRRGTQRELWVLITSLSVFLLFQEPRVKSVMISLVNLAPKFIQFARGGGLSQDATVQNQAIGSLGTAPVWVTPENEFAFLFVVWAILVVLTYILTNLLIKPGRGYSGWALLLGIINGIIFAAILLPRLYGLYTSEGVSLAQLSTQTNTSSIFNIVAGGFGLITRILGDFWTAVAPQRTLVILVLLTLFLLLVVSTLNGSGRRKSQSGNQSGNHGESSHRESNHRESNHREAEQQGTARNGSS